MIIETARCLYFDTPPTKFCSYARPWLGYIVDSKLICIFHPNGDCEENLCPGCKKPLIIVQWNTETRAYL